MGASDMLNLNTSLFRAALEIERCGSISRAAANLFVSQPNLSSQIRGLEKALGYHVFARSNTGVRVTEEGKYFLDSARIIMSEMDNIAHVPDIVGAAETNLSIVCVYSVVILNRYLNFRQAMPAFSSNDLFKETGLQDVLADMMEKRYRLGFLYELEDHFSALEDLGERYLLDFSLLAQDVPVLAIVAKRHPLAQHESIHVDELADTPLVAFEYLKHANWLEELGIVDHREVLYVFDRGGEIEIVSHGRHVGVSIGTPFHDVENDDVACIPITGIAKRVNQYWVKPQSYKLTQTEARFIEYVKSLDNA